MYSLNKEQLIWHLTMLKLYLCLFTGFYISTFWWIYLHSVMCTSLQLPTSTHELLCYYGSKSNYSYFCLRQPNFAPAAVVRPSLKTFVPATPPALRNVENYQQPTLGSQLYPVCIFFAIRLIYCLTVMSLKYCSSYS